MKGRALDGTTERTEVELNSEKKDKGKKEEKELDCKVESCLEHAVCFLFRNSSRGSSPFVTTYPPLLHLHQLGGLYDQAVCRCKSELT
jgi:hypothetical protein